MTIHEDTNARAGGRPSRAGAHAFGFDLTDGGRFDLSDCAGGPILVVNAASRCGFTGQYEGLVRLHRELGPRGLAVLAVPSNDFADQEPGDDAAIRSFCQSTYAVDFPIARKVHVTGPEAHPFYRWVRREAGILGRRPWWNFHKYLIGPDGRLVDWFAPPTKPLDSRIVKRIQGLLTR